MFACLLCAIVVDVSCSSMAHVLSEFFMCKQKDPKTNELEGLPYDFNLCKYLATVEQVSTVFIFVDACVVFRDVHKTYRTDICHNCHHVRYPSCMSKCVYSS